MKAWSTVGTAIKLSLQGCWVGYPTPAGERLPRRGPRRELGAVYGRDLNHQIWGSVKFAMKWPGARGDRASGLGASSRSAWRPKCVAFFFYAWEPDLTLSGVPYIARIGDVAAIPAGIADIAGIALVAAVALAVVDVAGIAGLARHRVG